APLTSGSQIYNQMCAACPRINRQRDPARAYPTLVNIGQKLKQPEIVQLLESGRGNMPSFAFLTKTQKEAVADLLFDRETRAPGDRQSDAAMQGIMLNEPYTHTGYNRWLDTNGYPAVKPPWGTLNAIDLNTGGYLWRCPLGEESALAARGVTPTGTENYGGPVVTASGLIFIAASKDEMIRAMDAETGKVLWHSKLPAGGYATPATYVAQGR